MAGRQIVSFSDWIDGFQFRIDSAPSPLQYQSDPMATYAQLKKQIDQLSKQAEAARQTEKGATLAKVREAVAAFELTPEEVFGASLKVAKKGVAAKSGAPKRTAKGAGQAKYRDPKTGATWTGFGRAPAWMASAKDRTKFLIAEQTAVAEQPAAKAVAKPVKKATAKKAVPAKKEKPVAKTAAKTKATVAKKIAPVPAKATAKVPAKKVVKVATAKKPAKTSAKPLAKAASAALTAAATPPASPQVAV